VSTSTRRRTPRRAVAGLVAGLTVVATVGVAALGATPASADTGTSGSASATVADAVAVGGIIHIEGTGWTNAGDGGSTLGIKLDSGNTEPSSGPPINPASGTATTGLGLWAAVGAEADGTFSADISFPTTTNTNPAIVAESWAVGTTHHLRLLTGVLESGDPGRSVQLTFTVAPALTATGTSSTTGLVTVAVSGSGFTAGEVLSIAEGATPLQWSTGRPATLSDTYTVPATGSISANVIFAAGTKRAGVLTLDITGDQGTDREVSLTVLPYVSFGGGTTQASTGTLTIGNLADGAVIDSVSLGDDEIASDLTASAGGTATADYSLTDAPLGTQPLVIVQSAPVAVTYRSTQKVSPDPTPFNDDQYRLRSEGTGIFQGLYQSAYSDSRDALFATAASGTGAAENGYLYKLDPDTLAVEASIQAGFVSGESGARFAPYGVGVDDVNGTVWVTNTRTATVAVYDADDLSLLKQYPSNTITHPRDAIYDPSSNRVFVSSASEGTTGDGYISVFEGGDNDGDGTPYEKIGDVQTGPRSVFNPVSLALSDGKLVSPSLQSDKVVVIDTKTLEFEFLSIAGIDVGGRGASGIAFDGADDRLFIASQNSDEVVIADASTGATIKEVATGTQALNVAWDAVHKLAYVTNFGSTNVTVLDKDGTKVANLPIARANHVTVDGKGNAYVVDKNTANKVWKIAPKRIAVLGTDVPDPTVTGQTAQPGTTPLAVTVAYGEPIHLEGAGFAHPNGSGSTIGIKLDSGAAQPAAGPVTNPVTGNPVNGVYEIVAADDLGSWSVDLPFPTEAGVNNASFAWGVGATHHLRLLTGSLESGDTGRTLAITVKVEPLALTTGAPTISGAPVVGNTVTAEPGTWTAGVAFTYQWKRAGEPIANAKGGTYSVTAADAGQPLTVTVTGSRTNYADASATSAAVTPAQGTLGAGKPAITGTARVGTTLKVTAGSWPEGATLTYQWRRAGVAIAGATGTSYVAVAADAGKRLSVVVAGALPGYAGASATSADTAVVAKGVLAGPKPRITGTAKVGKRLAAKTGAWTTGVKLTYVWKANGKVIKGAKTPGLKLSKALRGKRITVTVTGTKAGYATKSLTSARTKAVRK
jgi:hypothetical protein